MRRAQNPIRLAILVVTLITVFAAGSLVVRAQTPRGVTGVTPIPGQADVHAGTRLAVQFSQGMNRASVEAGLTLSPAASGVFVWHSENYVEFLPREPLALSTPYRATLSRSIRGARGESVLDTDFSWTFTTWATDPAGSIGHGLPVQVIPTTGSHSIPTNFSYNRMTVDVRLYETSAEQFVARAAPLVPSRDVTIAVEGLVPLNTWSSYLDAGRSMPLQLPTDIGAGLYVLEVSGARLPPARAMLAVTDHALVAKEGHDGWSIWVAQYARGGAAASSDVTLYDVAGNELARATADDGGVARLPAVDSAGAAFVVANADGQPAVTGLTSHWRTMMGAYYWWWWPGGDTSTRESVAHIHTDRPIYRPGHTVHYKATLRQILGDDYGLPTSTSPITVTVKDPQNNSVSRSNHVADDFGTIAGELVLSDEVSLGSWSIEVAYGPDVHRATFKVEDYVKPDYEVAVETDRPWYIRDEQATVTVQADYYFGQPVTDAEVAVRVYIGYYSPDGQPSATLEGRTDAEGAFTGVLQMPSTTDYAQSVFIEATITDASRRPVTAATHVIVHPADFNLELRAERYGIEAGQTARFTVQVTDHDGAPLAGRAVDVEVQQYRYRGDYDSIARRQVTTGADGTAEVAFTGLTGGWFSIRAYAADDAGRRREAYSYAWVMDSARPWYWRDSLQITADQPGYKAGDMARLLVRSPISTTALVTLERDNVYAEYVFEIDGATELEIPIDERFVPSVSASVHVWQPGTDGGNGRLLTAETQLAVEAESKRLSVDVQTNTETYAPGDEAEFTITTTDATGAPVDAQVSFALVDKAVLALTADTSGDIFDAFWGVRATTVRTYDSHRPASWYPDLGFDDGGPRAGEPAPGAPQPTQEAAGRNADSSQATPRRLLP
jgi:alpha-2-macroglobulin